MASAGSHGPRVKGGEGVLQEQTANGVEHLADGRQQVTWAAGHGSAWTGHLGREPRYTAKPAQPSPPPTILHVH